jgi:hypothetical protein
MDAFRRSLLGVVLLALAGCSLLAPSAVGDPPAGPLPFPDGCAAYRLSKVRCAAIVDSLRQHAGIAPGDVARVELLADSCGLDPMGQPVLCTRTTVGVVRVRFTTTAGEVVEQTQFCGPGAQFSMLCSDNPEIQVSVPTDGFRDVPCWGNAPDGCATPHPPPAPADEAREQGIEVAELSIALDHVGEYVVDLGTGSLASGILERSTMTIVDPRPNTFLLEGAVRLEIESLAPDGKPFHNYYERGWRPGLEPIAGRIRFTVIAFEPGAVLRITNIAVN